MISRRTKILVLTLTLFSVFGASTVCAVVKTAETGDYDVNNGKKLLFYGDLIKGITIDWWNADNTTQKGKISKENVNRTTFLFTVNTVWNASYILWKADVTDEFSNTYHFEGGFPIYEAEIIIPNQTNYTRVQEMVSTLRLDLTTWLTSNEEYKGQFTAVQNKVINSVDDLLSDYNTGLINKMKEVGLTKAQIEKVMDSVSGGFNSTLRDKEAQERAEIDEYYRGQADAFKLVGMFLLLIAIVVFLVLLRKDKISISGLRLGPGNKKKSSKLSDSINLDSIDL